MNRIRTSHDSLVFAVIVLVSAAAGVVLIREATGGLRSEASGFQSLVRGLGLGCRCDLGYGEELFDPRLGTGAGDVFDHSVPGRRGCDWHPITIFPAPAAARLAHQVDH